MVSISCEMGERKQDVEVGMSWTFSDIRHEVLLQLGVDTDTESEIWIATDNTAVKVNSRQEKKITYCQRYATKNLSTCCKVIDFVGM